MTPPRPRPGSLFEERFAVAGEGDAPGAGDDAGDGDGVSKSQDSLPEGNETAEVATAAPATQPAAEPQPAIAPTPPAITPVQPAITPVQPAPAPPASEAWPATVAAAPSVVAQDGAAGEPLLEIEDLHVTFRQRRRSTYAVDGLSLRVDSGRILAIIGESGSGKTVTARAVMGLLPKGSARVAGSIRFAGREMLGAKERHMRRFRGREVAMVFQNPERSLNPTMRIGTQVTEALRKHLHLGRSEAHEKCVELFRQVRMPAPERRFYEYPHQLSGGMRQRVMIAIALACEPKLLIADEATTALDVTTQAQIMDLLLELQESLGMALVMISHDLGLAASYAEDVVVMYAGRAVEHATTAELFSNVRMPYTRALLEAIPRVDRPSHLVLPVIEGRPPDLSQRARGCTFAPRCPDAQQDCRDSAPALAGDGAGHAFACWHPCGEESA